MAMTLEQQRAADAWQCAAGCSSEYAKLAKGVPALIMNSGLIQVLAFLHEKGQKDKTAHHGALGRHVQNWLAQRFPQALPGADFDTVMTSLMATDPQTFQDITAEAMAWLRWLRQIAPARSPESAEPE